MTASTSDNSPLSRIALLISLYFPPEPGGGATTAWNRALILSKIGYSVYVLCGFPSYPTGKVNEKVYRGRFFYLERMEYFTLIRLRLLPLESKGLLKRFILFINFVFLSLLWLPKILRISPNTKIVYALAPNFFSCLIGFIYSKAMKSFFIYEVSAFWPEELVAFRINMYFILLHVGKFFVRIVYILPDMIVVISEFAGEYLSKTYKPKALVYPLAIGVDPRRYHLYTKEVSRKKLIENKALPQLWQNKFIVLYSGVLSKITNVENLVLAASKIKIETDIVFLIIGEGEEKAKIERMKQHGKISNLVLLPFQPTAIVPEIIAAADICVVPLADASIYKTTVPTKFYDYLACNKPQVGICAGELARLIESNNIGVSVKAGDIDRLVETILFLKNSPPTINIMTQNSARLLKDFTLDNLASKFEIVLKKEIINKKKN